MNPEGDMEFVRVRWVDSLSTGRWQNTQDIEAGDPWECVSVGWIVARSKGVITIGAHIGLGQVNGTIEIPIVAVLAIDEIELPK